MRRWLRTHGTLVGAVAAFTVAVAGLYEGIAIVTPAPTWSRILQGIRDASPAGRAIVGGIAIAVGAIAAAFSAWVVHHLRSERRSDL